MELNLEQLKDVDVIVVGAGFSGAVMAERLASQLNQRVLVLEQRNHIAGNCYDKLDSNGVRIHQYGPHLFHTRHEHVWKYLSKFTEWYPYEHKVLADINGQLAPVPFNLNSLHKLFPTQQAFELEKTLITEYGENAKVPILELQRTTNLQLQALANFIYDKLFVNYTCKQWGCTPKDISPAVTARVPIVLSRDDRYFHDKFQALPLNGYAALIERMLDNSNIEVCTSINAKDILTLDHQNHSIHVLGKPFKGRVIYTGMLDELFDYQQGELSYRSLKFQFEQLDCDYFQPATTVNYPNEHEFTRITEFKHMCNQQVKNSTTIVKEFPQEYDKNDQAKNIPYYPVFNDKNQASHSLYCEQAKQFKKLMILGRLAEYKYFNMDDAVDSALNMFNKISEGSI